MVLKSLGARTYSTSHKDGPDAAASSVCVVAHPGPWNRDGDLRVTGGV